MSEVNENVVLHGDFFWGNVCWDPRQNRVVLLDWASAPLLGGMANYGSRYFDLLWFSWTLFFWMPPRRVFSWKAEALARALLRGYQQVEGDFQWKRYRQYRSAIRPLVIHFWKTKLKTLPSPAHYVFAEFLGCMRWFVFPLRSAPEL